MTETALRVAIIIASTREGRFGPTVGTWFAEQARQHGDIVADVVDSRRSRRRPRSGRRRPTLSPR
ncbi:hypothetical protein [Actinomadura sp. 9N215]|uniref:hypothetical protein n=1 Tax=Actinomadura sp. 9N215 TaxID=3375150 RepID=UPI0037A5CD19